MHDEGSLSDEDSNDADIAFITKGIRRFWRGKGIRNNSDGSNSGGTSYKITEDMVCYNCGDKGHISRTCTKKKETLPKKDKAMMDAWRESDSDEEQERISLGCFMVFHIS